jgi:endonuclease YncB( thermonuclease family)
MIVAMFRGRGMLSEIEITHFRSRIEDMLRDGKLTEWQRRFLVDMQEKIGRYGTRARLSDKQLSALRRITRISGASNVRLLVGEPQPHVERPRYSPRKRSRRFTYRQIKLIGCAIAMMAVMVGHVSRGNTDLLGFFENQPSAALAASAFNTQSFSITDGDTIRMSDGTPVRLVGFNAPETFSPKCDVEAALGHRATARLKQLVASGQSSVIRMACSCRPGTEGTEKCNYGRSCGTLKINGQDVGQTLIREGLAVPFVCGRNSCPPTPRPWCG